jgi:hypothetical protein
MLPYELMWWRKESIRKMINISRTIIFHRYINISLFSITSYNASCKWMYNKKGTGAVAVCIFKYPQPRIKKPGVTFIVEYVGDRSIRG